MYFFLAMWPAGYDQGSPAVEAWVLTTGPPAKSHCEFIFWHYSFKAQLICENTVLSLLQFSDLLYLSWHASIKLISPSLLSYSSMVSLLPGCNFHSDFYMCLHSSYRASMEWLQVGSSIWLISCLLAIIPNIHKYILFYKLLSFLYYS